jgi:hypothetical protein
MSSSDLQRRDFLRLCLAAGGAAALSAAAPSFSWAKVKQVKLADCMDMGPVDMAENSKLVMDSLDYLHATVKSIGDAKLRSQVMGILDNPAPTFTAGLVDEANKKVVYGQLKAAGMVEKVSYAQFLPASESPSKSPFPFVAAPGSGYTSHHSYPGGVVTHTAANLIISLAIHDAYVKIYGYSLNRDMVIASQALHDLHKPWVFQWAPSGESRTELPLAGTGEHHSYGVAETIARGLPAGVVVAQACAHQHPGWPNDEAKVVGWIKAATMLAGVDPVEKGLLAQGGKTLPLPRKMENFVCHLGDHDWVLTVPAAKWLIPEMQKIAVKDYGMNQADLKGKKFNQLRNYAFSQATIMTLYHLYSEKGQPALRQAVMDIVKPT